MISWLHYVLHADVPAFEAAGWRYASDLGRRTAGIRFS